MIWLVFFLIALPIGEIALLIRISHSIGVMGTLAVLLLAGLLGAFLARRQGLGVFPEVRSEMLAGRVPAGPLIDGIIILLASVLLIVPGVLTDTFAFICLFPPGRKSLNAWLRRRFEEALRQGRLKVSFGFRVGFASSETLREMTSRQPSVDSSSEPRALGGRKEPK